MRALLLIVQDKFLKLRQLHVTYCHQAMVMTVGVEAQSKLFFTSRNSLDQLLHSVAITGLTDGLSTLRGLQVSSVLVLVLAAPNIICVNVCLIHRV